MSSERGPVRQPEAETRKALEILDFENHIGLYGRLFMASQETQTEKIANIINPVQQVEFKFDTDKVSLDKRDYNPVFKNLSSDERQRQWAGKADAYNQWRTQFTEFMTTKIEKGSSRELALQAILPSLYTAKRFTEADADTLFEKFCKGKSDVHKFTSTLVSKWSNPERDSKTLKDLLPDFKWIASGLFGSQTAGMVTNLVYLESLLYNKQADALSILNRNKEKIRKPQDNELRVLGNLYNLIPEAERGLAQVAVPVAPPVTRKPAPVPESEEDKEKRLGITPSPPPASVPESTPEKPLQDMNLNQLMKVREEMLSKFSKEDKDKLFAEALNRTENQIKKMSATDRVKIENDREEMLRMDIANLRTILKAKDWSSAQPQAVVRPVVPEVKAGEESSIPGLEITRIEGSDRFQIKINGKDTGMRWVESGKAYCCSLNSQYLKYNLVDPENFPKSLDLPEDVLMLIIPESTKQVRIRGGANIIVPLSRNVFISLEKEGPFDRQVYPKIGEFYSSSEEGKQIIISLDDFKKLLNPQAPEAERMAATEQPGLTESGSSQETPTSKIVGETFSFEANPFAGITDEQMNVDYRTEMERLEIKL